ncbi:MAG: sulfite exporter TauE/SafE family protein, partial [Spirochaetae bacterium HGW-Spirochaetae-10]
MYEFMLLFMVAVLIAIFSASLGIGGGIFSVPVLI